MEGHPGSGVGGSTYRRSDNAEAAIKLSATKQQRQALVNSTCGRATTYSIVKHYLSDSSGRLSSFNVAVYRTIELMYGP